jgi:hypothetical protein
LPEPLRVATCEPYRQVLPKFPKDRCSTGFNGQYLASIRLARNRGGEAADRRFASADPITRATSACPHSFTRMIVETVLDTATVNRLGSQNRF